MLPPATRFFQCNLHRNFENLHRNFCIFEIFFLFPKIVFFRVQKEYYFLSLFSFVSKNSFLSLCNAGGFLRTKSLIILSTIEFLSNED